MAQTTPASAATPTPAAADQQDWPAQAADAIVVQVGKVRDRTTGPAIKFSGYFVFGVFAALLGSAAFVLFLVGAFRVIDTYLPDSVFGEDHTWAAYTILGTLLVVGGLLTGRKMEGDHA